MARISEKNPRYRTKRQIASDIAVILNADISYGTKYAVLNEVVWVWSEFYGKHKGCPWISVEAAKVADERALIHEHVVPKKQLITALFALCDATPDVIYDYLQSHCIGVLVTKDEDERLRKAKFTSSMPADWDQEDVWARNKNVGIEVLMRHTPDDGR